MWVGKLVASTLAGVASAVAINETTPTLSMRNETALSAATRSKTITTSTDPFAIRTVYVTRLSTLTITVNELQAGCQCTQRTPSYIAPERAGADTFLSKLLPEDAQIVSHGQDQPGQVVVVYIRPGRLETITLYEVATITEGPQVRRLTRTETSQMRHLLTATTTITLLKNAPTTIVGGYQNSSMSSRSSSTILADVTSSLVMSSTNEVVTRVGIDGLGRSTGLEHNVDRVTTTSFSTTSGTSSLSFGATSIVQSSVAESAVSSSVSFVASENSYESSSTIPNQFSRSENSYESSSIIPNQISMTWSTYSTNFVQTPTDVTQAQVQTTIGTGAVETSGLLTSLTMAQESSLLDLSTTSSKSVVLGMPTSTIQSVMYPMTTEVSASSSVAISTSSSTSAPSPPPLVANGGFESGSLFPWFTSGTGVEVGTINPYEGNYRVAFQPYIGSSDNGIISAISQVISNAEAGQLYTVQYYIGFQDGLDAQGGTCRLAVTADGTTVDSPYLISLSSAYQVRSGTFTASSTTFNLKFSITCGTYSQSYIDIDDISITPVQ